MNSQDEFWPGLSVRIVLAGGLYPILIVLACSVFVVPMMLISLFVHPQSIDGTFLLVPLYALITFPLLFGAGFIYAAIVCSFAVPAVALTLKLLDEKPSQDRVGVFTGSLVAFLATSPCWLLLSSSYSTPADWRGRLMGHGLLTLAQMLGQLAGLFASVADARRRWRGRLRKAPFRLTLWRMLAAMIPLSLTLSLLRLAERLTLPTALAMLAAGVTAYLASWPVAWLFHGWADRRLRRLRAKRLATGRST